MPVDLDEVSTSSEVGIETIHNAKATLTTVEARPEGFTWDHSLPLADNVSRIQSDRQQWRKPQRRRRPAHISVAIKLKDIKHWIKLRNVGDGMPHQIDDIGRHGPFNDTSLRKGDFLLSLGNEINWAFKRKGDIRVTLQGEITSRGAVRLPMVFETENGDPEVAEAIVFKESKTDSVGLAFMNLSGQLQIKNIVTKGLLGPKSALRVGDNVEFINGKPVSNLPAEAARDMIKGLVGKVSIRVRSPPSPNPSVNCQQLSAPAHSSTLDNMEWDLEVGAMLASEVQLDTASNIQPMFIGIHTSVERSNQKTLERVIKYQIPDDSSGIDYNNDAKYLNVTFVSKRGPFNAFPLEVGDVVRHKSYKDPKKKEFCVVLKRPTGTPGVVCAVARIHQNAGVPLKLGLTFQADQGGHLRIGRLYDSGLFGDSILASGDTVISMNGIPCHHMTPDEAAVLSQICLADLSETFTMLVRANEDRVLVIEGYHSHLGPQYICFVLVLVIVFVAWVTLSKS